LIAGLKEYVQDDIPGEHGQTKGRAIWEFERGRTIGTRTLKGVLNVRRLPFRMVKGVKMSIKDVWQLAYDKKTRTMRVRAQLALV
jgi:hypothetical protein